MDQACQASRLSGSSGAPVTPVTLRSRSGDQLMSALPLAVTNTESDMDMDKEGNAGDRRLEPPGRRSPTPVFPPPGAPSFQILFS